MTREKNRWNITDKVLKVLGALRIMGETTPLKQITSLGNFLTHFSIFISPLMALFLVFFSPTFELIQKTENIGVAYAGLPLSPHLDLAYLDDTPDVSLPQQFV